jgi:hypothetical protein
VSPGGAVLFYTRNIVCVKAYGTYMVCYGMWTMGGGNWQKMGAGKKRMGRGI